MRKSLTTSKFADSEAIRSGRNRTGKAALAANFANDCMFHVAAGGKYVTGPMHDPAIGLVVAYTLLAGAFVLAKLLRSRRSHHRRGMMVLLFSVTIALSIVLKIIWPFTPFTSLGCLVS